MKKNTGLVPGLIGIFLATVGIISFGFIFVPLAAIATLIGLIIAFANLSLSGIATNILATILTLIGLFTSPILLGIIASAQPIESEQIQTKKAEIKPEATFDKERAVDLVMKNFNEQTTKSPEQIPPTAEPIPTQIPLHNDIFSEIKIAALEKAIIDIKGKCSIDSECESNGFKVKPINLEIDDGIQFIVNHNDYCGAGGCTTMLVRNGNNGSMEILAGNFGGIAAIELKNRISKGVRFTNKHYKDQGGFVYIQQDFAWVGNKFEPVGQAAPISQ